MDNNEAELKQAALNAALLDGLGDEVTPSKLAAHLCIDSFELYTVLRNMGLMARGAGVRGSTRHSITDKATSEGLMFAEIRDGNKYGSGTYAQPLFTSKGAATVLHEVLANPPASLLRAKRLISIMLLADGTATASVPKKHQRKFQNGDWVRIGNYINEYEVKDFDESDNTYLLGGELVDIWEGPEDLSKV